MELSKVPPGLKPPVWWRETPGGHPSAATYQPHELLHDPKSPCLSFLTCPMARTAPPLGCCGAGVEQWRSHTPGWTVSEWGQGRPSLPRCHVQRGAP